MDEIKKINYELDNMEFSKDSILLVYFDIGMSRDFMDILKDIRKEIKEIAKEQNFHFLFLPKKDDKKFIEIEHVKMSSKDFCIMDLNNRLKEMEESLKLKDEIIDYILDGEEIDNVLESMRSDGIID